MTLNTSYRLIEDQFGPNNSNPTRKIQAGLPTITIHKGVRVIDALYEVLDLMNDYAANACRYLHNPSRGDQSVNEDLFIKQQRLYDDSYSAVQYGLENFSQMRNRI